MITICHTRKDGTLIEGSRKGDGVWEVLKSLHAGWRPMRSLGQLGLQQSRDKAAKTWRIEQAAQALREAGFEVEVAIDNLTAGRATAEAEADRADRAEERAGRYARYSSGAASRAESAYAAYRRDAGNWPLGQPVLNDRARRARDRMLAKHDTAMGEYGKAEHWSGRADAARAHQAHHEAAGTTLRRIGKLEARERSLLRDLDGREQWTSEGYVKVPPSGKWRRELQAELAHVRDQVAYWRATIAEAEAAGLKLWSRADFAKGDYVTFGAGRWYLVIRANPKTLTVPSGLNTRDLRVVTRDNVTDALGGRGWTDKVPYTIVRGRKTAAEIAAMHARYDDAMAIFGDETFGLWLWKTHPGDETTVRDARARYLSQVIEPISDHPPAETTGDGPCASCAFPVTAHHGVRVLAGTGAQLRPLLLHAGCAARIRHLQDDQREPGTQPAQY